MAHKRIKLLSCPIDVLTMQETIESIDQNIKDNVPIQHSVVNTAKLVYMQKNDKLYESVTTSDIINADGQAVVWAARLFGKKLPERVAGIDLMENLVKLAYKKKYKIFFLGAKEEVVEKVVNNYSSLYSSAIIAGYRNGYFAKTVR